MTEKNSEKYAIMLKSIQILDSMSQMPNHFTSYYGILILQLERLSQLTIATKMFIDFIKANPDATTEKVNETIGKILETPLDSVEQIDLSIISDTFSSSDLTQNINLEVKFKKEHIDGEQIKPTDAIEKNKDKEKDAFSLENKISENLYCLLCADKKPKPYQLETCGHLFHLKCIKNIFDIRLNIGQPQLKCPLEKCQMPITAEDHSHIMR